VPPFMAGPRPGGFGHPKGCHRLFPISTLSDYTSSTGVVMAVGVGVPPPNAANAAQARAMAERGAYVVAVRNLLEVVKGVQVDSATLVEDFLVKSDVIRNRVSGIVKGAQKIKSVTLADGGVEITVGLLLTGDLFEAVMPREFGRRSGPAGPSGPSSTQARKDPLPLPPPPSPLQAVRPPLSTPVPPAAPPVPKEASPAPSAPSAPVLPSGAPGPKDSAPAVPPPVAGATPSGPSAETYTGLIVDARGLGLKPALAPKLLDEQGKELYVGEVLTRDQAVQSGVAGYSKDLVAASRQARVTDNPLIVKGVRASGAKATDVVLGGADVRTILKDGVVAPYLRQGRVVLVYD